ncbi:MAG: hypothetical protein AB8G17_10670 [Gammaproteobacteria bacterium]
MNTSIRCALGVLLLAIAPFGLAQGNDDGTIAFTPSTARVDPLDVVALDVVLDFSTNLPSGGGVTIDWDPSVFDFVSWGIAASTVGGDTTSPGVLNSAAGTLSDVVVANSSIPLNTPGIMGTLRLQARSGVNTCQSDVSLGPSASNPWIEAITFTTMAPTFRRGRIAVGSAVCTSPPIADDAADMAGRCIGILPDAPLNGASCPNPSPFEWTVGRLFRDLTVNPGLGIVLPLADHMAKYCIYDRTLALGTEPDCVGLAEDVERLRPGMVVQSASMAAAVQGGDTPLENDLKAPLQNQFQEQAGTLSIPFVTDPDATVSVAIVDTLDVSFSNASELTRAGQANRPVHGDALFRFMTGLTSSGQVQRDSFIALPFNCFSEDTCLELCGDTEGCPDASSAPTGFLGTPESVARSIHSAVIAWSASSGSRPRLVINASLGWRTQFNEVNGAPRPGYAAFLDSLTEASCLGAIVIAAAGNQYSGPDQQPGPLSPASEGVRDAPTKTQCEVLGYAPLSSDFEEPRALIYPVGAVDAANQRLLTRPQGEPPLVAFGDHATQLGSNFGGGTLPTLTGSSVASLVVSAAVASAWTLDTDLPPGKVMDRVYDSGDAVGRTTEVCLPNWPCDARVRRITVCEAYASSCRLEGGSDCPVCEAPLPIQLDLSDSELDGLEAIFDTADTRTVSFAGYQQYNAVDLTTCNGPGPYRYYQAPDADAPLNPCPQDQFHPTLDTPWATGQPEHQSCENCSMTERSPGKLLLEIQNDFGSEFQDPTLFDATLLCRNRSTGLVNAFRLPDTDPSDPTRRGYFPGERVYITNIDNDLCPGDDISLAFSTDAEDPQGVLAPASLVQTLLVIRHDEDGDAVPDFRDNCILAVDPAQRDTDGDGIGNACDPDIAVPNDCIINVLDLGIFRNAYFSTPDAPNWNPDADFNGDLTVNVQDLGLLRNTFFGTPGPSAFDNACAP